MASRLVVLRQRLANAFQAALESFAEVVTPAVDVKSDPFLEEGETLFDFSLLQRVLGRMVEASFERMVEADKAHFDELSNDIAPRMERDRWVETVRRKLIDCRRIGQGLFGSARAVEVVAIDGSTGRQPDLLWRQAEHTLSRLRASDLELPKMSTAAVVIDREVLADELEPMVTALKGAIDAVELDRRAAANSHQAKLDAMADHDQLISACGRILSGFYLLGGRPDLADRIRLSLRPRRSQNADASSDEVSTGDAATDAEPSPDADTADSGGRSADVQ